MDARTASQERTVRVIHPSGPLPPVRPPSCVRPIHHLPPLPPRSPLPATSPLLTMSRRATASWEDLWRHAVHRAVEIYHHDAPISLREAMRRANEGETKQTQVTYGSLYRALHPPAVTSAPAGRRTLISAVNQLKLKDAIMLHEERGFTITKQHLREAVACIIADMPEVERSAWKHYQPCETWARDFCQRQGLRFLAKNRLDAARARATTKENYAHFAILSHLLVTHNISPDRLSNWDESGFSFEKMASGRAKVIVCKDIGRSLTRGVNVGADAEHITLGAANSASGHAYSPIFVLL